MLHEAALGALGHPVDWVGIPACTGRIQCASKSLGTYSGTVTYSGCAAGAGLCTHYRVAMRDPGWGQQAGSLAE